MVQAACRLKIGGSPVVSNPCKCRLLDVGLKPDSRFLARAACCAAPALLIVAVRKSSTIACATVRPLTTRLRAASSVDSCDVRCEVRAQVRSSRPADRVGRHHQCTAQAPGTRCDLLPVGWKRLEAIAVGQGFYPPAKRVTCGRFGGRAGMRSMPLFLDSAAGSLLSNRDRGEPQHHVAGDSEMETVEPPDCAAPIEIVHGERAPYCYGHPRHRLRSSYHLETSTSRAKRSPCRVLIGDGSL